MNIKSLSNKRWSVIRKSTGKLLRSFDTRSAARSYKQANRNTGIFDNVRLTAVR